MGAPLAVLLLLGAAPFALLSEAGAQDGQVYLRQGSLLVGAPDQPGRPGFRLGSGRVVSALPEDLAGYQARAENCDRDASRALSAPVSPAEGRRVVGWVEEQLDGGGSVELVLLEAGAPPEGALLPYAPLYLALYRERQRVAEQALEITAFPCALDLSDLTGDGRADLVVVWLSAGGSGVTRGASVFGMSGQH